MTKEIVKERNITDNVLERFNQVHQAGALEIPSDYSPQNALKSAWFTLQSVKDKNDKLALNTCTPQSIANSLYEMVVNGLNPMKKQCYFIAYGNELTCMTSYQGDIALAKRYSNVKSVIGRVIRKDDKLITKVLSDNREVLVSFDSPFENQDNDILGGFCVIIDSEGNEHLTKMTKAQIIHSWNMGNAKGKSKFHNNFEDQAIIRTLIKRACKPWINSSNDESVVIQRDLDEKQTIKIDENQNMIEEPKNKKVQDIQPSPDFEEKAPEKPEPIDPGY